MTSNVVISVLITLVIIAISQSIIKVRRKAENVIYKNPKMAKEYVKKNKVILEKGIDLNKKTRLFLLISIPVLFIVFFTIPILGIVLLIMDFLILIMFVFNILLTRSVKDKIKKFENL